MDQGVRRHAHEDSCEKVIRLEARFEAMERWRDEFQPRFEALEEGVADLKAAQARQFGTILVVLCGGFLSMAAGLVYIIMNHALLP